MLDHMSVVAEKYSALKTSLLTLSRVVSYRAVRYVAGCRPNLHSANSTDWIVLLDA